MMMIFQQDRKWHTAVTSLSPDNVRQQVQTFVLLGQRSLLLRSQTLSLHSEGSEDENFLTLYYEDLTDLSFSLTPVLFGTTLLLVS